MEQCPLYLNTAIRHERYLITLPFLISEGLFLGLCIVCATRTTFHVALMRWHTDEAHGQLGLTSLVDVGLISMADVGLMPMTNV